VKSKLLFALILNEAGIEQGFDTQTRSSDTETGANDGTKDG
jgi:hypothetical protein